MVTMREKKIMKGIFDKLFDINRDLKKNGEYSPVLDSIFGRYLSSQEYHGSLFNTMVKALNDYEYGELITLPITNEYIVPEYNSPHRMMDPEDYKDRKKKKSIKPKRTVCKCKK